MFWGIVVLNAIVAACLVYFSFRVSGDDRPSSGALATLAFIAFLSACLLSPVVFAFPGHGPILLTASKLALLCLVAEIVVTVLVATTAIRLSEARTA